MVQRAYKGKRTGRGMGHRRQLSPPPVDTGSLASKLGFTQGRDDVVISWDQPPAAAAEQRQPKRRGNYIGRYVVGSRAVVQELTRRFPELTAYHPNERMVLPLLDMPNKPIGRGRLEGAFKQATKRREGLRLNMSDIAVDDQLTWSDTGTGLYQVGLGLAIGTDRWPVELEEDREAVSAAINIRKTPLPGQIIIATTPIEAAARDAANYATNEAAWFAGGLIELTGIQICEVPTVDIPSGGHPNQ